MEEITDSDFDTKVLKSQGNVLVFFSADWCSHCKVIEPTIKLIQEERKDSVVILYANVDKTQKHSGNYSLQGIPTLLLFQNGVDVGRITGAQPKESINNFLNTYVK